MKSGPLEAVRAFGVMLGIKERAEKPGNLAEPVCQQVPDFTPISTPGGVSSVIVTDKVVEPFA